MGDSIYNKYFFNEFYAENGGGNYIDKNNWSKHFSEIAQKIVDNFAPKTVLDAGCACGYLVEALRNLGVEAYGIDISEYAIESADADIKPFLNIQSITEPLPKSFPEKFDLVVTIEVLEHLFPTEGRKAIELLCSYADTVIFTSTPDDITDRTHVNVQKSEYWAEIFACNYFYRDLIQPMEFICPWAMLFRKNKKFSEVIFNYELNARIDRSNFEKALTSAKSCEGNVYFDCGNLFTDDNKIVFSYYSGCADKIRIAIPSNCKKIRIDPIEDKFISIKNLLIGSNLGELPLFNVNAKNCICGTYYFETTDPQIIIDISNKSVLWIEISFNAIIIDSVSDYNFIAILNSEIKRINSENYELNNLLCKQEKIIEKYSSEIEYLKKQHMSVLEDLKKSHRDDIDKLINEHSNDVKLLNDKYISESDELNNYKEHYFAAINQRDELKRRVSEYEYALNAMRNAQFWKITAPARKVVGGIKNLLRKNKVTYLICKGLISLKREGFKETWKKVKCKFSSDYKAKQIVNSYKITSKERILQEKTVFDKNIKISILVPLYNTPIDFLDEMIASVKAQTYANWELCLADGSDKEHDNVKKEVLKLAKKDERIKYKKLENNLGISENTNACIDMSTGDYIALFDHDDVLHSSALFEVMNAICKKNADVVYTDEATFESPNIKKVVNIHYKPDYSPDTLRSYNYICHFFVFEKKLLDMCGGGFRKECDGSQDYDIILRLTEVANKIVHISKVLYFWRSHSQSVASDISAKPYTLIAAKLALTEHLKRQNLKGCVLDSSIPSTYRIKYDIQGNPLISIIIANKDHVDDLDKCINSIKRNSTYKNYEIIIVENNSVEEKTFDYYETLTAKYDNIKVITWSAEFNYSKINNFGFKYASGEYIILLNNDIEIITPDWIEEMLMFAQRKDVGAAGMMLYYSDDTVQHAGVILGIGGVAGHSHKYFRRGNYGYASRLTIAQNLSAVTAASIMIRSDVYCEVNGLDESFAVAFNDVDLCMRIRKAGYLIVWTPYAEAYHYESKSRGFEDTPEKQLRFKGEIDNFSNKWHDFLKEGDPYYNPNLTLDKEDFSFR